MSFRSILRSIVEECGGGLGAVLMGSDGIPIEEYVTDPVTTKPEEIVINIYMPLKAK